MSSGRVVTLNSPDCFLTSAILFALAGGAKLLLYCIITELTGSKNVSVHLYKREGSQRWRTRASYEVTKLSDFIDRIL